MGASTVVIGKDSRESPGAERAYARGRWSSRFWWASIFQGFGAAFVTALVLVPGINPSLARVMTNGGPAGMWLALGYVLYVTVGVVATAVTAVFYDQLEVAMRRPVRGFARYLAGAHLALMSFGVAAVCALLMYGGYVGGAAMLPTSSGGLQLAQSYQLLTGLVLPASIALGVALLGFLCGGLVFVMGYARR